MEGNLVTLSENRVPMVPHDDFPTPSKTDLGELLLGYVESNKLHSFLGGGLAFFAPLTNLSLLLKKSLFLAE